MPISVYFFRPNSFHRCSNFTSHCRSSTSLPQKRPQKHAHAFHFPACFQVQLTYFHIHVTFSFCSPPLGLKYLVRFRRFRCRYLVRFRKFPVHVLGDVPEGSCAEVPEGSGADTL